MVETEVLPAYLTPRRRELLEFIISFNDSYGYSPTNRELQRDMGYASVSTVNVHLHVLRQHGAITWEPGKPRTIKVTEAGHSLAGYQVL